MTSRYDEIRAHLQAEGQRDFIDLWPRVIAGRAAFLETLRGLSAEEARRRPEGDADGEEAWSAVEVAQHVISYTRNVGAIVEATASGRTETKLPPGHLEPDPNATLEDVRRALTAASAWLVDLARRLPAEANLGVTVPHAAFGELNCRAWLAFIAMHDGIHAAQVRALRTIEGAAPAVRAEGAVRERLDAAATQDFIDLWPAVAARRAALLDTLVGLNDEQARWRPGGGEGEEAWSAIEVAQHLARWSSNVSDVIEATASGGTETKLPPGYLEPDPAARLGAVRRDLTGASAQFLSTIDRMPATPDLEATVAHSVQGPMNCRMWFAMASIHDVAHTEQIETLKQSEGFPS